MAAQATRKISPGIIDASLRELQAEVADLPEWAAAGAQSRKYRASLFSLHGTS